MTRAMTLHRLVYFEDRITKGDMNLIGELYIVTYR
jgi:hypothetical protein